MEISDVIEDQKGFKEKLSECVCDVRSGEMAVVKKN